MMSVLAPWLPWIVGGVAVYAYRNELLKFISGRNVEEFKKDTQTVTSALKTPVTTSKEIYRYVTNTTIPQGATTQIVKGKRVVIPYPSPKSIEEFRANVDAINAALVKSGA
jgi:hypothetical protein